MVSDLTPTPVERPGGGAAPALWGLERIISIAPMAQGNLFLIPKGALVKEDNKDTDAKVGVITEMFLYSVHL